LTEDACDSFGTGRGVRFCEDLLDVPFDRAFGHEQSLRDCCAGVALGDQAEDLELSGRERRVEWVDLGDVLGESLEFAGAPFEVR
jgi:hypothetical protein